MPAADLAVPRRLLAGGGPSTPDDRVLRALTTPAIGQFDPAFTALMDDVMQLARTVLLTTNTRCFPVSGLASAGVEALLNTLVERGDRVAGDTSIAAVVSRYGGVPVAIGEQARFTVVRHVDPTTAELAPLRDLATRCHDRGSLLIVDATLSLGGCELRTDAWGLDAVVAGVEYCLGAPSGMALVTYSDALEDVMRQRTTPPPTSYLDLLQLQAYWSAERLNHHTAPTSLVYGLREALRLVDEEGIEARWARHRRVGTQLAAGLAALGLDPRGGAPFYVVMVPEAARLRRQLVDEYGVYVQGGPHDSWRIGLLGADARLDTCRLVLGALANVLNTPAA